MPEIAERWPEPLRFQDPRHARRPPHRCGLIASMGDQPCRIARMKIEAVRTLPANR